MSGVDYLDSYVPVARMDTIKILIALNVISAFLNGFLKKEIYLAQSEGFVV